MGHEEGRLEPRCYCFLQLAEGSGPLFPRWRIGSSLNRYYLRRDCLLQDSESSPYHHDQRPKRLLRLNGGLRCGNSGLHPAQAINVSVENWDYLRQHCFLYETR